MDVDAATHYSSSLSLANSTAVTLRATLFGLASDAPGLRFMAGTAAPTKTQVNVQDSRHSHLQQPVQAQQIPTRTKSISAPAKSGGLAFRCQCNGRGGVGPCLGKFSLELPNFRRRSALRRCLRLRRWFSFGRGLAKRSLSTAAPRCTWKLSVLVVAERRGSSKFERML